MFWLITILADCRNYIGIYIDTFKTQQLFYVTLRYSCYYYNSYFTSDFIFNITTASGNKFVEKLDLRKCEFDLENG